jgi:methionyl-tRNA formyltransferase
MRIVVHGQEAFGKAVLEKLLERGENIVAVCCAPDKPNKAEDPLKAFAREKGLALHQPKSWKTPEALALMQSFNADVCIMAYVLLFIPQPVLDAPRLGTFQYHPSLLPAHRGPSSINWPIAQGKTRTGLTIFWPDEGLDEGPVLLQKSVEIGPDESLGDVYFKKLFPMGVDAMIESLDLVKAGTAPKLKQNLADGSTPVADIYNTIRAANPAPGAWSTIKGIKLDIYDATKITTEPVSGPGVSIGTHGVKIGHGDTQISLGADGVKVATSSQTMVVGTQGVAIGARGTPGSITSIDANGITIAANGGAILAKRVKAPDGKKIPAAEWAASASVAVGDTFDPPAPKA